ncbi:MAG: FAD-dependent tricarballylate dehydrogenase TcuA [Xanthobacteraceae bacterium]
MNSRSADIVVVGAGLAGLSAALEARATGASVLVLERAPIAERGGNSRFSNGAMRAVYGGVEDIDKLVGGLSAAERARADFGAYSREQYFDDMGRVTQYRADPELSELLIDRSAETMTWLQARGVKFLPLYEWHPATPDGRIKFSGGSALETHGAGEGLSEALFKAAERAGISIAYETRATELLQDETGVIGVRARIKRQPIDIATKRVVLACGGFEANPEWRTRYLGPSWELAKVRGSRFNTGDGLRMALDIGAMAHGNWSGCHSASWDLNAPDVNELAYGTVFKRDDYMFGLIVNANGERFIDEGSDVRAVTYAKLGRIILAQPGQVAWQIFDAKVAKLVHGEYRTRRAARFTADALPALVQKLEGIDREKLLKTIADYNNAVPASPEFDASKKDGRATTGLAVPKSNWAQTIDTPPFEAYAVTCGITFTFGGLRVDTSCRVIDDDGEAIPGLFAAGEIVGGIFYFNYPGGAGLMSAAVFGRIAGVAAAGANT